MGKRSKRPGRESRDIHDAIREAAELVRRRPAGGMSDAAELPALAALMDAARDAIDARVPSGFEFHGRRYYLRSRLAVQFDIFDGPAAAVPLVCGASFSLKEFGHAPGH